MGVAPDLIDPDDVAALLAEPPEGFVAARTARVKALKAEGRKEEAAALGAMRKPVRLVWIVGELARRHPDVAATAAEVAEELEEAQAGGGGVRPLLKRFRDAVTRVAELADEIEGTVDRLEVGLALREVLADPDAREEWLGGRLLALPGDDDADAEEPAARPARRAPKKASKKATAAPKDEVAERRAQEEAAAEARRAAEEEVAGAEAAVAEATTVREEAAAALSDREDHLTALEAQLAEARAAVEEADAALATAESALTEAESAHTAATEALAALDPPPHRSRRRPRRR